MNDADILRLARQRYQQGVDGDSENRARDLEDRTFLKGGENQWDSVDLTKRKARGRISVTVNRCNQFVKQITGEMRQNKPAIKVLPVDDKTDPKLAEVYTAIVRHIESQSDGHRVYSKAGEQAVNGGIGWFRILTDYCDGKSFDQEIFIKGIRNPLAVVFDPGAVEPLMQDMHWAFVSELVPEETFKAKYPTAKLTGFDSGDDSLISWRSDKSIRVAEYWVREAHPAELLLLSNGATVWGDELTEDDMAAYTTAGIGIVNHRKSERYAVKCYKITGVEVLESYDWDGSFIPLIPVIGEELEAGDEVFRHGLIHFAKDAQRGYNLSRSAMLETVAGQPKAPFLLTPKMIEQPAIKQAWEQANEGNPFALPFIPDPAVQGGAPIRLSPPNFASAWYQEALAADGDMKAATGIYDASLGRQSNETSGRAIMARDQQGETASYVYVDNLAAAIRHCGRCLIDLIPKIYTGERVIRIMGEDGAIEGFSKINAMLPDGSLENDISRGQFDLEVTTGPSFATKRLEAADRLTELLRAVPQIAQAAPDLFIKVLDIPYSDKIADRVGLLMVPPGVDPDLDKKRMEMQAQMQQMMGPPPPDPMQEMAFATGKAEIDNKNADTELKMAKTRQTEVQTETEHGRALIDALQAGHSVGMGDGP